MNRCLDIKLTITEWIKSILEIMFECMFSKMTEGHLKLGMPNIELDDDLIFSRIVFLKLKNEVEP